MTKTADNLCLPLQIVNTCCDENDTHWEKLQLINRVKPIFYNMNLANHTFVLISQLRVYFTC